MKSRETEHKYPIPYFWRLRNLRTPDRLLVLEGPACDTGPLHDTDPKLTRYSEYTTTKKEER